MLTLNDGRAELWQWDTGRTLAVDADCSQVHFSNKVFGRSIDVDVVDGAAIIPDILLQTDNDLNVWAFVGTAENGYTKISKIFTINRRNKPADYVFTPTDQMTLQTIQSQIGDLADLTTEEKTNLVAAINEAAASGGAGSMDLRVADGYVQYSTDGGNTWQNLIAVAELKGADGTTPTIGSNGNWYIGSEDTGNPSRGETGAPGKDGADGKPGAAGANGVTPHIGDNGNWYLGETDTGKPSRGADGATGATGATGQKGVDGKSAYQYAKDGGYTGTEAEFAAKLASGALIVTLTDSTDSSSDWLADKSYNDIRDAILAGIPVYVFNGEQYLSLAVVTDVSLFFGAAMGINDETGVGVFTTLIEITNDDKFKNAGNYVAIPATLPNPNALTFTGAVTGSYDGSAPLSVDIPSGGSSSGEALSWKLIRTINIVSGTSSYSFNTDNNGNAFNVKNFLILIDSYPAAGYLEIKPNGTLSFFQQSHGKQNYPFSFMMKRATDGRYILENSNTNNSIFERKISKEYSSFGEFTSFDFWFSTNTASDTTMYILGEDV